MNVFRSQCMLGMYCLIISLTLVASDQNNQVQQRQQGPVSQKMIQTWLSALCQVHNPLYIYDSAPDWSVWERYLQKVKTGDFARYGLQLFFDQEQTKHALTLKYIKNNEKLHIGICHFSQDHTKDKKTDPLTYFIKHSDDSVLISQQSFEQYITKRMSSMIASAPNDIIKSLIKERRAILISSK